MDFYKRFRALILFLQIAGFYIKVDDGGPKTTFKKILGTIYKAYCAMAWILMSFLGADYLYCTFAFDQTTFRIVMGFFTSLVFVWTTIKYTYFLINANAIHKFLSTWSNLNPTFQEKLRKNEIDVALRRISIPVGLAAIVIGQVFVTQFMNIFWYKQLTGPSMFAYDVYNFTSAPMATVFYQNYTFTFCATSVISEYTFILLSMNLIEAEYAYLNKAVDKIINSASVVSTSAKKSLCVVIQHHANTIKLFGLFQGLFGPFFVAQYLYLTTVICGLMLVAQAHESQIQEVYYSAVIVSFNMARKLTYCRCGDRINELSQQLGDYVLTAVGKNYPKDVVGIAYVMAQMVQRDLFINFRTLLPINSETFKEMVLLQYQIYACISTTTQN